MRLALAQLSFTVGFVSRNLASEGKALYVRLQATPGAGDPRQNETAVEGS